MWRSRRSRRTEGRSEIRCSPNDIFLSTASTKGEVVQHIKDWNLLLDMVGQVEGDRLMMRELLEWSNRGESDGRQG